MNNCHIIGVMETDGRHNVADIELEKLRAKTGGEQVRHHIYRSFVDGNKSAGTCAHYDRVAPYMNTPWRTSGCSMKFLLYPNACKRTRQRRAHPNQQGSLLPLIWQRLQRREFLIGAGTCKRSSNRASKIGERSERSTTGRHFRTGVIRSSQIKLIKWIH